MKPKICIYCMGEYGIKTYLYLKDAGVDILCFGDRDEKKWGYVIDGLECISYEDVLNLDRQTEIIVAVKNPEELIQMFKKEGFCFVFSKDEAMHRYNAKKSQCKNKSIQDVEYTKNLKNIIYKAIYKNDLSKLNNVNEPEIVNMLTDYHKRDSK